MRLIFLGDVVGRSGRDAITRELPGLRERYRPDLVVVNGENAAHGFGRRRKKVPASVPTLVGGAAEPQPSLMD